MGVGFCVAKGDVVSKISKFAGEKKNLSTSAVVLNIVIISVKRIVFISKVLKR